MQLKQHQELIGTLTAVVADNHIIKGIFSMMTEIEIPIDAIDEKILRKYIGQRIGLLNNEGKIRIRKIIRKHP